MAFPVNGILDAFTRADSTTTVGTNWTAFTAVGASSGNEGILSNQLYNPHGSFSNYTGMYWNPTTFGPDMEVYMSLPTKYTANAGDNWTIYLRSQHLSPVGTENTYNLQINVDNNQLNISRSDAGVGTQLGASVSQTISSGDKAGLSIVGSTITVYYNTAGTWNTITTRTDSTYTGNGSIGWYIPGNTQDGRFDDFGGGTLASAAQFYSGLTTMGAM